VASWRGRRVGQRWDHDRRASAITPGIGIRPDAAARNASVPGRPGELCIAPGHGHAMRIFRLNFLLRRKGVFPVTKVKTAERNSGRASRARPYLRLSPPAGRIITRPQGGCRRDRPCAAQGPHVLPMEPGVPGPGCSAPGGGTGNTGQFASIGTGLSTVGTCNEVAQWGGTGNPGGGRGNDPVVLAHGRHVLHGVASTTILEHDLRRPGEAYFCAMVARKP
jgi:hypothetical protein